MTGPTEAPAPKERRPTGLLVAAGLLILLNVLGAMLQQSPDGGLLGPRALGAATAQLLIAGIAYGLGALSTRTSKRHRRGLAAATAIMGLTCMADVVNRANKPVTGPSVTSTLTDADRSALQVTSAGIHHPGFGFTAPHPGEGFVEDTAAAGAAVAALGPAASAMHVWMFSREEPFGAALLQVTTSLRNDEPSFRGMANGMRKGLRDPAVATVLRDTLIWTHEAREYLLTVRHAETGLFIGWRCLPRTTAEGRAFIVCAMRSGPDTTGFGQFTNGLTVTRTPANPPPPDTSTSGSPS